MRSARFRATAHGAYEARVNGHPVSDAVLEDSQAQRRQASIHNILAAAKAFATTDFRPDLASFKSPTLVIHGTKDATVPIDATAREVAKAVPGAQLTEYEGSAHGLFASDKERLIDDLLSFLTANLGGASSASAIPLTADA